MKNERPRARRAPNGRSHGALTARARRPVWVLVCGSADRADDGAALAAVAALPAGARFLAEIRPCGGLDIDDLLSVPAGAACLIVDAAVGVGPGEVAVGTLEELAAGQGPAPRSSHALPAAHVLALAAALRGRLPPGAFVGLGAMSFRVGGRISPPVAAAIPRFSAAIAAEIERLASA